MEKIILTKKEFKEAMEVLKATAKENIRPVLQGVNFNSNEVVGLSMPDTKILTISQKIDNKEKFVFNVMQQDYINYKQLIPTKFNLDVTVEAKKIIDSIKPLRKNHYVILDISKDIINIKDIYYTKRDKQGNQEKIISTIVNDFINCNTVGDNKKIAFNNTFLKEALKNYKENIDMKIISPVAQMVITDNNKKLDVVLPVRLIL